MNYKVKLGFYFEVLDKNNNRIPINDVFKKEIPKHCIKILKDLNIEFNRIYIGKHNMFPEIPVVTFHYINPKDNDDSLVVEYLLNYFKDKTPIYSKNNYIPICYFKLTENISVSSKLIT
jgi:hypothetical protein